jgi:hypothetical protein
MTFSKALLLVASIALLSVPPIDASHSAPAPRITGSCSPTKVRYALSTRGTTTTSTDPVTIADTAISFTQAKTGCVIVDFTAFKELDDPPPGTIVIRPLLKNSSGAALPARPSTVVLNLATGNGDVRTIQFMFPDVVPGNYTLRMQMNSMSGGGILVSAPNVVVHYN